MIFKNIDKEEFKKLMNEKNTVILDNRTEEEYNEGHIEGAVLIDYHSFDFEDQLDELERDKKYLIYCRSGRRSAATMNIMRDYDFVKVYNLTGGILEWNK